MARMTDSLPKHELLRKCVINTRRDLIKKKKKKTRFEVFTLLLRPWSQILQGTKSELTNSIDRQVAALKPAEKPSKNK